MPDAFSKFPVTQYSVTQMSESVTPSDTVDLPNVTRGIYVGTSGDVRVDLKGGTTVTFRALAAGLQHGMAVTRVHATGTTATDILAVW